MAEATTVVNIPTWIQQVGMLTVGAISIVIGVWRYIKTEIGKTTVKPTNIQEEKIATVSFIDSKLVKELIDTLVESREENGRVSDRIKRSNSELRESLIENSENVKLNTDGLLNMVRFITRQNTGKQ